MFGMGTGVTLTLWAPRTGFVRSSTISSKADGTKAVLDVHVTHGHKMQINVLVRQTAVGDIHQ